MRKRNHTQGLDQLGPTQDWKVGVKMDLGSRYGCHNSITTRVLASIKARKVKITLPDMNSLKRLLEED
jgi:hypothetical protein